MCRIAVKTPLTSWACLRTVQFSLKTLVSCRALYIGVLAHLPRTGPQIAWRTVFVIEYLGPLLIHPLLYYGRSTFYKNPNKLFAFPPPSLSATLSFWMIMGHFFKRELETLFVHRFSNATMPAFNIFKNSAHYWLLGGLNIALFTYSPSDYSPTSHDAPYSWLPTLAIVLYVFGELGNFWTHLTLMGLRSQGGSERGIPVTGAFKFVPVTCPNYFFEVIAWIGIWIANRSLSTGLFTIIAGAQMAAWARKKESRYRREFGSRYKRKRFAMLPGIV